ncbi:hypothetical protein HPB50_001997 [Hyalomma asiaticum]|uniref:Uncharacterized protein n=1 Tax=Hyalomma asiaticum TaxID=266040 RepID=A0ACB7RXC4_HYAAI|nr:hypothetical protein HPB50_001997 [Hyalomma asiaticum]
MTLDNQCSLRDLIMQISEKSCRHQSPKKYGTISGKRSWQWTMVTSSIPSLRPPLSGVHQQLRRSASHRWRLRHNSMKTLETSPHYADVTIPTVFCCALVATTGRTFGTP